MTKRPAQSRGRKRTARGSRAPTKAKLRAKAKAAVKRNPAAPAPRDPLDDFVIAAAAALGLPIEPQWRQAIRMNLDVILRQGALVNAFPLPDEAEPAPVFRA